MIAHQTRTRSPRVLTQQHRQETDLKLVSTKPSEASEPTEPIDPPNPRLRVHVERVHMHDDAALKSADGLLQRSYGNAGYVEDPSAPPQELCPHQCHPGTTVLMAVEDRATIIRGTLSVIPDGKHGLPADAIFGAELQTLRAAGAKLAEVGAFATDTQLNWGERYRVARALFWETRMSLGESDVTHVVITVNPTHVQYHVHAFGFEATTDPRPIPKVNGALGVLLVLDLSQALGQRQRQPTPACSERRYCTDDFEP